MSFLDTIKDRVLGARDDYYEDDYYDDYEGEEGYDQHPQQRRRDPGSSPRVLGTTPRPEAESVSVYTRSGRPVATDRSQQTRAMSAQDLGRGMEARDAAPLHTPGDLGPRTISRNGSSQLPPYVLKPVSYDDVQTVVRRVRTNQPVVIVFRATNIEVAKRILDFCFGFSCGINGSVEELGDRVFAVLPANVSLTATDIDKLVADGDLVR